jgi:hypothetical protein
LAVLLLFGSGPRTFQQEQDNQSQPVDQIEVNKNTGTVQKVDTQKRKLTVRLDNGKTRTFRVDKVSRTSISSILEIACKSRPQKKL